MQRTNLVYVNDFVTGIRADLTISLLCLDDQRAMPVGSQLLTSTASPHFSTPVCVCVLWLVRDRIKYAVFNVLVSYFTTITSATLYTPPRLYLIKRST